MQAVLYDLHGTLVDTAPDIAAALDTTLRRGRLRGATLEQVRSWIGDGTRATLAKAVRAAGVDDDAVDLQVGALWPSFEFDYAQACGERGRPYPGARRMLERLTGAGIQVGLVTNKEAAFAHRLLARHDLHTCFDLMVCGDTLPVRKPDPLMLQHALQALQCAPDDALYVGDSALDVRTARAAGVAVWAVSHGYGGALRGAAAPDRLLDGLDELARALTTHSGLRVSIL
ncbi:MAG TPA: HAD-IA family hydrolase [Burkholderiaceae bacterium]|nr:HAD-IA family hydrolase [Burkholderiaceae bacterium]